MSSTDLAQRFKGTHGSTSERKIKPLARAKKRNWLRHMGLRAGDLTAQQRGYLELYVRAAAKTELIDRYIDEHGLFRPDGELVGGMKAYVSLLNSARLSLRQLEDSLRESERERRGGGLGDYIEGIAVEVTEEQA